MTLNQIKLIKKIISEHMNIIKQLTVGGGKMPSPTLLKKLRLPKDVKDLILDSFKYGKASVIAGKSLKNMNSNKVKKIVDDTTLPTAQQKAVELSRMAAQAHIDNLTTKITATVISLAVQKDSDIYSAVKDIIPEASVTGVDRSEVTRQLREQSKDWERDWNRVANSEMWNAKVYGEANAILNGESPLTDDKGETYVFKTPAPNACAKCKELYLEKGTNKPKVFKLSELIANGTNYGKKQAEWVATLGIVHPNCMCTLSVLPSGYYLDENGNMLPNS